MSPHFLAFLPKAPVIESQPIHHIVNIICGVFIILWLKKSPFHGIFCHCIVEVVTGKCTVGIIWASYPAVRHLLGIQCSSWKRANVLAYFIVNYYLYEDNIIPNGIALLVWLTLSFSFPAWYFDSSSLVNVTFKQTSRLCNLSIWPLIRASQASLSSPSG